MEKSKKPFNAPRVLQRMEIELELDLLAGPSSIGMFMVTGQQVEEPDAFLDSYWD